MQYKPKYKQWMLTNMNTFHFWLKNLIRFTPWEKVIWAQSSIHNDMCKKSMKSITLASELKIRMNDHFIMCKAASIK